MKLNFQSPSLAGLIVFDFMSESLGKKLKNHRQKMPNFLVSEKKISPGEKRKQTRRREQGVRA